MQIIKIFVTPITEHKQLKLKGACQSIPERRIYQAPSFHPDHVALNRTIGDQNPQTDTDSP